MTDQILQVFATLLVAGALGFVCGLNVGYSAGFSAGKRRVLDVLVGPPPDKDKPND